MLWVHARTPGCDGARPRAVAHPSRLGVPLAFKTRPEKDLGDTSHRGTLRPSRPCSKKCSKANHVELRPSPRMCPSGSGHVSAVDRRAVARSRIRSGWLPCA